MLCVALLLMVVVYRDISFFFMKWKSLMRSPNPLHFLFPILGTVPSYTKENLIPSHNGFSLFLGSLFGVENNKAILNKKNGEDHVYIEH